MKSITLLAVIENLVECIDFVRAYVGEHISFDKKRMEIELVVEEALVNIFKYAYPQTPGQVEINCNSGDGTKITIEIKDNGIPFDGFFSRPDPDIKLDLKHRNMGGLGVFFIKKMADEVRYNRSGDTNILTVVFYA